MLTMTSRVTRFHGSLKTFDLCTPMKIAREGETHVLDPRSSRAAERPRKPSVQPIGMQAQPALQAAHRHEEQEEPRRDDDEKQALVKARYT